MKKTMINPLDEYTRFLKYTSWVLLGLGAAGLLYLYMIVKFPLARVEVYTGAGEHEIIETLPTKRIPSAVTIYVVRAGKEMTFWGMNTIDLPVRQTTTVPAVTGTVSKTGFFTGNQRESRSTFRLPSCGTGTADDFSLVFADGNLRITERMSTPICGGVTFSTYLFKEELFNEQ